MTAPVLEDQRIKPLPAVAAWFAARHADDQDTIANNLILGMFPLWQIMRFNDLDASTTQWLSAVLPRIETTFLQSQRLSAVFNANVRFAELPFDDPLLMDVPDVEFPLNIPTSSFRMPELEYERVPAPPAPVEQSPVTPQAPLPNPNTPQWVLDRIKHLEDMRAGRIKQQSVELQKFDRADVAKTMTIEANYRTKRSMPGQEDDLMRVALSRSSGAAVRESLNGGRGVTDMVMRRDKKVIGFARVTDNDPCGLCALLASRGAVYGKGSFITTDKRWKPNEEAARDVPDGWTNVAKVHDNCRCMLRPVYSKASLWDAGARHYLNLWENITPTDEDVDAIRVRNPGLTGYLFDRKVNALAFRRAVRENPFPGNQFDLNILRRDVEERMNGLLNVGFSPSDPQIKWHEATISDLAS